MKWFFNMKIRTKLLVSFILVAMISGAMGLFGISSLDKLNDSDTILYENYTEPLETLGTISTEFQRTRVNVRDLILAQTPDEFQTHIDKIKERQSNIEKLDKEFETRILNDDLKAVFKEYQADESAYYGELDKVIQLAKQNRDAEAVAMMAETGDAGKASRAYQDIIAKIMDMMSKLAHNREVFVTETGDNSKAVMIAVIILVMALSIFLGLLVASVIAKPLRKSLHMIEEMSMGHFSERLDLKTTDEVGQMANAMDFLADELQTKVIGVMNMISRGDVSLEIQLKDEKDEIAPAMKQTVETIRGLNSEVQKLIQAVMDGKLDMRGETSGYSGAWENMIVGVNGLINAFVAPINVTAEYVERISKGDIPPTITESYYGDFNEIKNNLNNCIEVMNSLLGETNLMIKAAEEGRLDIRGDASMFNGEWGTLVQGVNNLVDAFVAPINMTAEYVKRISAGDIPSKITDTYKGDFNEIKNNLNSCIDVMNGLLEETSLLIKFTQEGKLDIRGDAGKFNGEWGTLVGGVNDLVDAFVQPINLTAEYVDRISKGDIPAKITDIYYGDFNEIKINLNNCIDIMNGLLSEANKLIVGARGGQLDVRADSKGFTGSWEELVEGMNQMIDNVAKPVKEVTSVMNEMSVGNMHVSVKGSYDGEFGILSHAVNHLAMRLLVVIGEISRVLGSISEGNLTIDKVEVFKGDFFQVSNSMNLILDSLNEFIGAVNTASDQVSVGSKQVSDGSQTLSQGATEQASSVEELTASVTELASLTKENASSANEANQLTQAMKDSAELGTGHMTEMLQAMEEISESSNNISKIIKVIDDIAFQTNILALNAAVEAARAGQHGKGFAVVAEEVRNLAARSAEAAKDTTELIQGSIKKSSVGTNIANSTSKALQEIVAGVSKTAGIISAIANSSNEQAMGITQINTGLGQVSQVVQNNAATAEQSAASSEELSGQAEMLKEMVGKFRLRKLQSTNGSEIKLLESSDIKKGNPSTNPKIVLGENGKDKY
jgi:Methyl-accepting chemotaxis protein